MGQKLNRNFLKNLTYLVRILLIRWWLRERREARRANEIKGSCSNWPITFFFFTTPKGKRWVQNGELGLDNKTCPPKIKRYNCVKTHSSCETSTGKQKGTHTDGMRWRIVSCIANTNKSMTPYPSFVTDDSFVLPNKMAGGQIGWRFSLFCYGWQTLVGEDKALSQTIFVYSPFNGVVLYDRNIQIKSWMVFFQVQ